RGHDIRSKLAWLTALGVLALALAPSIAHATTTTWVVDNADGGAPNSSVDGVCDAPGPPTGPTGDCTLPEAVKEASAAMHTDIIHFSLPANTTINLQFGVSLDVNQPMTIDGCFPVVAATAPCVGIDGSAINSTTMVVTGNGTTVEGLAMTGGQPES